MATGNDVEDQDDKSLGGAMASVWEDNETSPETDDGEGENVMGKFRNAKGFQQKSYGIEAYCLAEPGRVYDMDAELQKSKEDREEEAAQRQRDLESFTDMLSGLRSGDKSWTWKRWRIAVFSEGQQFKFLFISLVCINGILIGIESDHGSEANKIVFQYIEACFLTCFTIELSVKLLGLGYLFFTDGWNDFDFAIVTISMIELVLALGFGTSNPGLSAFRLLRIFRIVRVVGFVARLNMLVNAFITAMQSVMWVGILVIMCVYIGAIMAQGFFHKLDPLRFGDVGISMMSMFMILCGDGWASGITRPLGDKEPMAWAFVVVFVLIGGFGLLNLLTGVFIESLMEVTKKNDIDKLEAKKKERKNLIKLVGGAFQQTDEDGGGTLDQEELPEMLILLEEWKDMLDHVGLDHSKMKRACLIADYSHDDRSYWLTSDATGEPVVQVFHEKFRPPPEPGTPGFSRLAGGDEGVMEGEIVECLTDMDSECTVADFYTIMKKLRLFKTTTNGQCDAMNWRLQQRLQKAMSLCGGNSSWEPPAMPEKEVETDDEEEFGGGEDEQLDQHIDVFDSPTELTVASAEPSQESAALSPSSQQSPAALKAFENTAATLFERYDLDGSGTLNTRQEMKQLVTNMIFTRRVTPGVSKKVLKKMDSIHDTQLSNMDLDAFMKWYLAAESEPET